MILDTTFLIDLLNNEASAAKKSQELDKSNMPIFTTTISVFEIWQGIADIKNKEKLEKINILLSSLGLLQFDFESAKIAGKLYSELKDLGATIQPEDCMIAGVCLKHNKKLLTRNVKHFSRIKNLQIENY